MIFLFGTQKSGTTWLRNIAGEVLPINKGSEFQLPLLLSGLENHVNNLSYAASADKFEMTLAAARDAWKALLSAKIAGCVMDKSAYPCFDSAGARDDGLFHEAVQIKKLLFPDSIQIMIVRDPRDVLVSSSSYFNCGELTENDVLHFANNWASCNLRWLMSKPSLIVRYEDLKRDFEETVRKILRTLSVDVGQTSMDQIKEKYEFINYSRNIDGLFFRSGEVGQWNGNLNEKSAEMIVQSIGEVMEIFGYLPDGTIADRIQPYSALAPAALTIPENAKWNIESGCPMTAANGQRCFVFSDGFSVIIDPRDLKAPQPGYKISLLLDVKYEGEPATGGNNFSLAIVKEDGKELRTASVEILPCVRSYRAQATVAFELSHEEMSELAAGDRLRINLFNGGVGRPFVGVITAFRWALSPASSSLARHLSQTRPARQILESDKTLDFFRSVGWSSLHFAANWGMLESIVELIAIGVSPGITEKNGASALHRAADFNHLQVAQYLVEHGAPLDAVDNNLHETPLDVACRKDAKEVASYLTRIGAKRFSELNEAATTGEFIEEKASEAN